MFAVNCYPPASPEAIVNAKLVVAMHRAGWDVDVLSRDNTHGAHYPNAKSAFWDPVVHATRFVSCVRKPKAREQFGRVSRQVHHLTRVVSNLTWILSASLSGCRLAATKPYDLILSRSGPASSHLAAMMASRKTRIPWIANWNDPEPWSCFPPPYGQGPETRLGPLWGTCLRAITKHATWSTFPCERLQRYMCSYLPGNVSLKSSVIPHIALPSLSWGSPQATGRFVLCHAGNLGAERDPGTFLAAVKAFMKNGPGGRDVELWFVGGQNHRVSNVAEQLGIRHIVKFWPAHAYDDTQRILQNAAVLVIIEARMSEGIFLPSKFVDYVQAGRSILAISPKVGTLPDVLSRHGGGLAADNSSQESITDAITQLYSAWQAGTLDRRFGSGHLLDLYGEDCVMAEYVRLIDELSFRKRTTPCRRWQSQVAS